MKIVTSMSCFSEDPGLQGNGGTRVLGIIDCSADTFRQLQLPKPKPKPRLRARSFLGESALGLEVDKLSECMCKETC